MSKKIELKKSFPVSAEAVFNAWLNPESVKKWMCPGPGVTVPNPQIDAKVGGKFQFDMQMGDKSLPHFGEYKVIAPYEKLQFTWVSANTQNQDSVVTINIQETGDNQCELVLMHELLPTEESIQDHTGGWTRILECLIEEFKDASDSLHG